MPEHEGYAMYYLTETDPRGSMGLGGKEEDAVGSTGNSIEAIDYKTGKIAWRHEFPAGGNGMGGGSGLLATAGKLVFGSDAAGNFVAYDAVNGKALWHSHIGSVGNAPETYMLDGHQYVLVSGNGDRLYAFVNRISRSVLRGPESLLDEGPFFIASCSAAFSRLFLTQARRFHTLVSMKVRLKPETESRLNELASQSGPTY